MSDNIINKIIKRNPINSWRSRRFKKIYSSTILILSSFILALSPLASKVFATSAYDTVVQLAPSWEVIDNYGNSQTTNIEDAIANVSNTTTRENCEDVYAKYVQMDYRVYVLLQPSRYDTSTTAMVFATNDLPGETEWNGDLANKYARAIFHNFVGIYLKWDSTNSEVVADQCADGTNNSNVYITYAQRFNDGFTVQRPYLAEGFSLDYPTGYEGDTVPSASRTGLIQGSAICANTNNVISAVYINAQSGLDGDAKLSDIGDGAVSYSYYLSEESPYSIVVLCDGDPFYGPTVNSDFYDTYNWACAVIGEQNYCAAS